jgi:hypothetical protein
MGTAKDSEVLPEVSNCLTNLYRARLISIDVVRAEVRGGTRDCVTAMRFELVAYSACYTANCGVRCIHHVKEGSGSVKSLSYLTSSIDTL